MFYYDNFNWFYMEIITKKDVYYKSVAKCCEI